MMLAVGGGLLAGCDDTLFGVPIGGGPVEPEYSVDWAGIEDMFAANYEKWIGARKKVVWL